MNQPKHHPSSRASRPFPRSLVPLPVLAVSWFAFADDVRPPRFVQTGHATHWTWPAPSTKAVAINDVPGSGPIGTPYLVDWNVDYIVYRLKDVNQRNGGNVCCQDAPWIRDVRLTFAVESEHLAIGSNVVPYDCNPQNDPNAAPIPAVGVTPTGLIYEFSFRAGQPDLPVWFAFAGYTSPPTLADLHEVTVRLISAVDNGQPATHMGHGWNSRARFIYGGYNPNLVLTPANDPGSGAVLHFKRVQATTKIPFLGTEVLHEGSGYGIGPGGQNEYRWHDIVIKDADVESTPGSWRIGGDRVEYVEPLTITVHAGDPASAIGAATPGVDYELLRADGSVVQPEGTVPESWELIVPPGSWQTKFGVRVLREVPAVDEHGWEEVILTLGAPRSRGGGAGTSFPAGSTLTPPGIGWKSRLRFLIEDGE